jgi:hypothetical protein
MSKTHRFWLIYCAAWLPYAAGYAAVFVSHVNRDLAPAIEEALYNVAPAALLGAAVILFCRRFPWPREQRVMFVAAHLCLAVVYALLWVYTVPLLFALDGVLRGGRWSYQAFAGYALQWQSFAGVMIYGTLASTAYALETAERLRREEARAARASSASTAHT